MSLEEKNCLIKENPAYGRIICRCEGVTEGEILDALRRNPKATDLDGVKRRTRAQMGRCQGGFCSPYIIELLAQELGIPYEAVTKSGGASFINVAQTKGGQ
jgi:glycerol-3-phosphate dehydrogenase